MFIAASYYTAKRCIWELFMNILLAVCKNKLLKKKTDDKSRYYLFSLIITQKWFGPGTIKKMKPLSYNVETGFIKESLGEINFQVKDLCIFKKKSIWLDAKVFNRVV